MQRYYFVYKCLAGKGISIFETQEWEMRQR